MRIKIAGRTAPMSGKGRVPICLHHSQAGRVVRQTSVATDSGPLPRALSLPLFSWGLWTAGQHPRGYQAWLLSLASPHWAQSCPIRGDNSGHSSNLELFSPYQLVSAGPPDTHSQGGSSSGSFPGQERAATVQHVVSQQWGKAAFTWGPPSLQARAPRPGDFTLPLLPQASKSFFPVPYTWQCGPELKGIHSNLHTPLLSPPPLSPPAPSHP